MQAATSTRVWAAQEPGGRLEETEVELGPLGERDVEIAVESCGICHSDLSMLDNDWGMTQYPFVPGHEIVGKVAAVGSHVQTVKPGQTVGLGWYSKSCMRCDQCMAGDHNLCPQAVGTIVGRHGGFADRVRGSEEWVLPLPEGVNAATAGPLFCGGITVFNPIVQLGLLPTHSVGVIGIGGLGHMALAFLHAWGCRVVAFSTSPEKEAEARELGADAFLNTRDADAVGKQAGTLDAIISTVNVELDWDLYVSLLKPRGKLHTVGAVEGGFGVKSVFPLIMAQRSLSASPLGSPRTTATMLEFAGRKHVEPIVETYSFDQINDAIDKLRNGKPRYRLVLQKS
jgi:uncharacterized zinc-type alcohol dehydrogenase-like protein